MIDLPTLGLTAGGLGLFLVGMGLMTDGLKLAAGPALHRILAGATRTRQAAQDALIDPDAPAAVVVPYQYTLIVWAVILGYLVFGDFPNTLTWIGIAIIIGIKIIRSAIFIKVSTA